MTDSSAFARWQVGAVRITRVQERQVALPATRMLSENATPDAVLRHEWLRPDFATEDGSIQFAFNSFVLESDGHRILVDTGIGNHKERPGSNFHQLDTNYLDDLRSAGFDPDDIDLVVSTHMHVDHVGWNTQLVEGRWIPTFPRARYLFVSEEWDHWRSAGPQHWGDVTADSLKPVVDAGLVDLVSATHALSSHAQLEPAPGHTPGHTFVRIRSEGDEAVIIGDMLHHPVQLAEPTITSVFDSSPEQALETRRQFLAETQGSRVLVLGSHFADPTGGRIVQDGDVHRFVTE